MNVRELRLHVLSNSRIRRTSNDPGAPRLLGEPLLLFVLTTCNETSTPPHPLLSVCVAHSSELFYSSSTCRMSFNHFLSNAAFYSSAFIFTSQDDLFVFFFLFYKALTLITASRLLMSYLSLKEDSVMTQTHKCVIYFIFTLILWSMFLWKSTFYGL